MNTLLQHLNPATHLTCAKAMEIARVIVYQKTRGYETSYNSIDLMFVQKTLDLLQSYEALLNKKLSREMFVCEVEKPNGWRKNHALGVEAGRQIELVKAYELAQSKVIFEGFEEIGDYIRIGNIMFDGSCLISLIRTWINPTIGDLLTEIAKYNETATSKINLQFTENVLKELGI